MNENEKASQSLVNKGKAKVKNNFIYSSQSQSYFTSWSVCNCDYNYVSKLTKSDGLVI